MCAQICVIANPKSGKNSHDKDAIDRAMAVLGPDATVKRFSSSVDPSTVVANAIDEGCDTIVAAGGDGTIMAVTSAVVGTKAKLGVLPLGTFNYFARGLGIPEDAAEAASVIRENDATPMSVGTVNGQVFLNNASIGVYPAILKDREDVYKKYGRWRVAAYWSVIRTFIRFQRPIRATLRWNGNEQAVRTPLVFVARSAFQLESFGLKGTDTIDNDGFAVFVARGNTRRELFGMTWRLVTRRMREGTDYDLIRTDHISIETNRGSLLVACDGEKFHMTSPLEFEMITNAVDVIMPGTKACDV